MSIVREVVGILIDALRGSRCILCGCRDRNLSRHVWTDHGDEERAS